MRTTKSLKNLEKPEELNELEVKFKSDNKHGIEIANYAYYLQQEDEHIYSKQLTQFLKKRGISETPKIIMRLFDNDFVILNKFMILVKGINSGEDFNFPTCKDLISHNNVYDLYPELFEVFGEKIIRNILDYTKKGVGKGELFFKLFTKNVTKFKNNKGDLHYILPNGDITTYEVKYYNGTINVYNMDKAIIINTNFKNYCNDKNIDCGKLPETGVFATQDTIKETFNYIITHNPGVENMFNVIEDLLKISFIAQYVKLIDKAQTDFIENYINIYTKRLIVNNSINDDLVHTLLAGVEIHLYQKFDKWDNLICFQKFDDEGSKRRSNLKFNYGVVKKENVDTLEHLKKFTDDVVSNKNGFSFSSGPHIKRGLDNAVQIHYNK